MLALMLATSLTLAADSGPPGPCPTAESVGVVDVELLATRYRRNTRLAQAGLGLSIAGPLLLAVYVRWGGDQSLAELGVLGAVSLAVGPPMLAIGSLAARRSLVRRGGQVSAAPGLLGLGAYAAFWATGYLALSTIDGGEGALEGLTLLLSLPVSVVLGGVQLVLNAREARRLDLDVRATPLPGGGAGLSLAIRV